MRTSPDRENLFHESLALLSSVTPSERAEVLMHYFMGVLGGLEPEAIQRLRDELTTRFGGRFCSGQVCHTMAELANGHLAGRQRDYKDAARFRSGSPSWRLWLRYVR